MKKNVLFTMLLIGSTLLTGLFAAAPQVDPAAYATRLNYKLTSKWAYTNTLGNYNSSADLLGAANSTRGMTVKNGKMLFCTRNTTGNQIIVVDGATGAKEAPITLASNVFTYLGRNKTNTADSIWTTPLACNDIHVDDAGNVLVCNLSTSNTARFQVWKIDLTTGNGTVVIDQASIIADFPLSKTGTRFDAFGVWGDVNTNAVIMAANAEATVVEVYKWTITNGVVGTPVLIELDNTTAGTALTGKANLGSAPRVLPVDANYFYVDGNSTYPTLVDGDGNVIDDFFKKKSALTDSVSIAGTKWVMNEGHNGIKEFQIGSDYFVVMAATNTAGVPKSTFRVFKFADANKAFSGLDCMWTFPQAGMGGASNSYRTGMPAVEVNGNTANIYVYTGENGYAMYTISPDNGVGVNKTELSKVNIQLKGSKIIISEEVKLAEIYSVSGQKIATTTNVSEINAPNAKGIYLVTIIDKNGAKKAQKISVN